MHVPYNYLDRQFKPLSVSGHPQYDLNTGDSLTARIFLRIEDVVRRGDFTLGREVQEFEDAWCEVTGAKYAVGVSNGTDAIALALLTLPTPFLIHCGVPANTFVGTANAVTQAGCQLEFLDVSDQTMNLDKNHRRVLPLPVAWCGLVPKADSSVMDGAQAIGARNEDGSTLTSKWQCVTYSLHPLKNINVWGDGGVITTDDPAVADTLRLLRNHGLKDRDHWEMPGYNHRLSTLQAAVGLEVLKEFPFMWERRHQIAYQYHAALKETRFRAAQPYSDISHAYHVFQIRVPETERDGLLTEFAEHGVEVKVHYPIPLHKQKAAKYCSVVNNGSLPNVEQQAKEIITLPMHEYLTDEEVAHVCDTVKRLGGDVPAEVGAGDTSDTGR